MWGKQGQGKGRTMKNGRRQGWRRGGDSAVSATQICFYIYSKCSFNTYNQP